MYTDEEQSEILNNFATKLWNSQESVDPELRAIMNKYFDKLLEGD